MKYIDIFKHLKAIENFTDSEIEIDSKTVIRNYSFESNYRFILPGGSGNNDDYEYISEDQHELEPDIIQEKLNKKDAEIMENIKFRYHIIMPKKKEKSKEVIFLFHGLNEKHWNKYLPWAKYIVDKTGKAVILYPIAFHMNRAPSAWSDVREMYAISQQRMKRHPNILHSSLSNVAMSTRLHNKPQRFIWSGLQTYYDIIDFIENFKAGNHPAIDPEAKIDIVSYSIGSFLSEILIMTNQNGYFSNSKLVAFCGGAVFNRLSPVSKFILDSEADVSLYSYVVEHIESHMKRDEVLGHYLRDSSPVGVNFRSMLNYKVWASYREEVFRKISDRIYAIALAQDAVVPSYEVINTLQGSNRDIPIKVDILDYPYKYKHEDPFPALTKIQDEVDKQFRKTFDMIIDFLEKK